MEYLTGLLLASAVAGMAAIVGLDRDRAFYPTVLSVIASYYVLFVVMGASLRTLLIEIVVASFFLIFAVLGYKKKSLVCSSCYCWSVFAPRSRRHSTSGTRHCRQAMTLNTA